MRKYLFTSCLFISFYLLSYSQTQEEIDNLHSKMDSLKKLVADSYELIDKQVVISSPGNKFIFYKLSTAFDIIVAQEKRHFDEAIEVLTLLQHRGLRLQE